MDNKLDQILEAIGLSKEDLTPEEIKQLEEAISNNDEDTIMDILTPKLEMSEQGEETATDDNPEESDTASTEDTPMPTEEEGMEPMEGAGIPSNSEGMGEESIPSNPEGMEDEGTPTEETPNLNKEEPQSPEITDDFVKQNYDEFKNNSTDDSNTPAYNVTSSTSIDSINPENPETIESLSIDEMLNILSGKEDENLKDNTNQMNGEDPDSYVDEVKEAVSQEIKKKVNGNEDTSEEEGNEEEGNESSDMPMQEGMM